MQIWVLNTHLAILVSPRDGLFILDGSDVHNGGHLVNYWENELNNGSVVVMCTTAQERMIGVWERGGLYSQDGLLSANRRRGGASDPLVAKGWVGAWIGHVPTQIKIRTGGGRTAGWVVVKTIGLFSVGKSCSTAFPHSAKGHLCRRQPHSPFIRPAF